MNSKQAQSLHFERLFCLTEAVQQGVADADAVSLYKQFTAIEEDQIRADEAAMESCRLRLSATIIEPEEPEPLSEKEKQDPDRCTAYEQARKAYDEWWIAFLVDEEIFTEFDKNAREYEKRTRPLNALIARWYRDCCPERIRQSVRQQLSPSADPGIRQSSPVSPLPLMILHDSSPIHAAVMRGFIHGQNWTRSPGSDLLRSFKATEKTTKKEELTIIVGLPNSDKSEEFWQFLCQSGPQAVKAHYALWARWYEEGGPADGSITVSINQFCSDIGFTKAKKGGFKREQKQEALRILETLTAIELRLLHRLPTSKDGRVKERRVRGRIWEGGLTAEEREVYGDLFGQVSEGDPKSWEPISFSFRPGEYFRDHEWRKRNRAIGKMASGLMELRTDRDEWAILIGGYLGTLARTVHYAPKRLCVGTILERINRAQDPDSIRRVSQYRMKFERALEHLEEVGVIASWHMVEGPVSDIDDFDDPAEIAAYYNQIDKERPWRKQVVEVSFPNEHTDGTRLDTAEAKKIKASIAAAKNREKAEKKSNAQAG